MLSSALNPPPRAECSLRFGRFELQPAEQRLLVDGVPAALGARALQVLQVLVERAGHLVSRSELLDRVWADVVVEENNLSVQINALRKVLGGEIIATVPGRGYRFMATLVTPSPLQAATALPAAPARKTAPQAAGPLLGRAEDLAALDKLARSHRLVTVLGAGGVGKSRLAQALLEARAPHHRHGVGWVELGGVTEAAALPGAIAAALGVRAAGSDALTALAQALAPLDLLVVLDNAEHLADTVAHAARLLLAEAPALRLLVTSQLPLQLSGEQLLRLQPLAVPPPRPTARQALTFGAVQLFVERAQAADSRFLVSDANAGLVTELCCALDGVALAIELAAARAPWLGLAPMLASMAERLQLLGANPDRNAPQRQQTLRDALAWSHGLLDATEQRVFRRLAVVAGSATLALIQQTVTDPADTPVSATGATGGTTGEWMVLDALGTLVDRSLVEVLAGPEAQVPRYRLLDTPRAFALEQLEAAGETTRVKRRHMQAMAERCWAWWDEQFSGSIGLDAQRERQLPDWDNVRQAWATAQALGERSAALSIGSLMMIKLRFFDERAALVQACEALVGTDLPAAVQLRTWLAVTATRGSLKPRRVRAAAQLAVDLARTLDVQAADRFDLYQALSMQSWSAAIEGDEAIARSALDELLTLEDPGWPPHRLYLGQTAEKSVNNAFANDPAEHLRHTRRSHELALACGNHQGALWGNTVLAELKAGHAAAAVRTGMADLAELEGSRHDRGLAFVRQGLVSALLTLGRTAEAEPIARAGWPQAARYQLQPSWSDELADLASQQGRHEAAVQLIGYGDASYGRTEEQRLPLNLRKVGDALARAEAALGATWVAGLRTRGTRLADADVAGLAFGSKAAN